MLTGPVSLLVTTRSSRPVAVVPIAWTSETPDPTGSVTGRQEWPIEPGPEAAGPVVEVDGQGSIGGVANDQVVKARALEVGRDDLRRELSGGEGVDEHRIRRCGQGEKRDGVVIGVDAGQKRALQRPGHPRDVAGGMSGIDGHGREERTGLTRRALAIEDLAGAVDYQDVVGMVTIDVGDQRVRERGRGELTGIHEGAVAQAQEDGGSDRDVVRVGDVEMTVIIEVACGDADRFRRPSEGRSPVIEKCRCRCPSRMAIPPGSLWSIIT